jgi:hypothetical protein
MTTSHRPMKDYAVISLHEKGFWQIDVYWKMERPPEEDDAPDHFKTCKIGEPIEVATKWCLDWYMHAEVLFAVSRPPRGGPDAS